MRRRQRGSESRVPVKRVASVFNARICVIIVGARPVSHDAPTLRARIVSIRRSATNTRSPHDGKHQPGVLDIGSKKKKGAPPKIGPVGWAFATLFASAFAIVGVWAAGSLVLVVLEHRAARQWVEAPATVTKSELSSDRGARRRGGGGGRRGRGNGVRIEVAYRYDHNGETYTGERVGHATWTMGGPYKVAMHGRLTSAIESGETVTVYVNPDSPATALLDRELTAQAIGVHLLLAVAFGGVGFLLLGGIVHAARR